ncbi:MAG: hypothetical protein M1820_005504 [Bogoriella megaspora]|nr:MAG: hypothetical protein M1820_005504 [Bogoriella megaspora]
MELINFINFSISLLVTACGCLMGECLALLARFLSRKANLTAFRLLDRNSPRHKFESRSSSLYDVFSKEGNGQEDDEQCPSLVPSEDGEEYPSGLPGEDTDADDADDNVGDHHPMQPDERPDNKEVLSRA